MPLADRPVLAHVIDRCKRVSNATVVCCATTFEPEAAQIIDICRTHGVPAIQGPLDDVLARYLMAARELEAAHIVRITSDCPFIDPAVVDQLVDVYRHGRVDYANNIEPRTYPHGLDCEVFSRALLEAAAASAVTQREREHVTPWMREQVGVSRAYLTQNGQDLSGMRWTLDYPADLDFFRAVVASYPAAAVENYGAIARFLDAYPEYSKLNADLRPQT